MADKITDIAGRPFDKNGIRPLTMPFVVTFQVSFLMEARDEDQAKIATQRGISFNAGLVSACLGMQIGAEMAPPEILDQVRGQIPG